jgi:hypothetical protein
LIPSTLGAVVGFLLLLAPGISWELQSIKHEPTVKQSALVELSRIVLASLLATATSAILLLQSVWMPLYKSTLRSPTDPFSSPHLVVSYGVSVILTSALACLLTLIVAMLRWPKKGPIRGIRVWHRVFVASRPPETDIPYLTIELLDGTIWKGRLRSFDSDPEDSQRALALGQPLRRKRPNQEFEIISQACGFVVLAESQIKSIQVAYPRSKEDIALRTADQAKTL